LDSFEAQSKWNRQDELQHQRARLMKCCAQCFSQAAHDLIINWQILCWYEMSTLLGVRVAVKSDYPRFLLIMLCSPSDSSLASKGNIFRHDS